MLIIYFGKKCIYVLNTYFKPVNSLSKKWMTTVLNTKLEKIVKRPAIPKLTKFKQKKITLYYKNSNIQSRIIFWKKYYFLQIIKISNIRMLTLNRATTKCVQCTLSNIPISIYMIWTNKIMYFHNKSKIW